uniref:Uncharacterized protein n=1 Tax=Rhizophora mucronata TaxID=61149 RepID=A0A2P2QI81_RHIMU
MVVGCICRFLCLFLWKNIIELHLKGLVILHYLV